MKKKIVFKKTGASVELNTMVEINDVTFPLTKLIAEENPHLFEFKEEQDESESLLEKVKREYPVGTWVKSLYEYDSVREKVKEDNYYFDSTFNNLEGGIWVSGASYGLKIYSNGKWAEKALFVTEDGKPIFYRDKYYVIESGFVNDVVAVGGKDDYPNTIKRFSTREAAQEYLDSLDPKLRLGCYVLFGHTIVDIKYGDKDVGYISLKTGILYMCEDYEAYNKWIENGCKVDTAPVKVGGYSFRLRDGILYINSYNIFDFQDFQKEKVFNIDFLKIHPNGTIVVKTI